jgi:hypothetical protein
MEQICAPTSPDRSFSPPTLKEVEIYFNHKGLPDNWAQKFFIRYSERGWTSFRGNAIRSWKSVAYRVVLSYWRSHPLDFQKGLR